MFAGMEKYDVVVIGAGFAGVSSAWHLAKSGVGKVLIIEQEEMPGMHSSGLNAGMIRQFEEDKLIASMAVRGSRFIADPPSGWERSLNSVGSFILFKKTRLAEMEEAIGFVRKQGTQIEIIQKDAAIAKVPVLNDADFDLAVQTPSDGVADINKLLWSYINGAKKYGAALINSQKVCKIEKNGRGNFEIETNAAAFEARYIVNAAGAWASELARISDASKIELAPFSRHLYVVDVDKKIDSSWPFVWDIDHQYYFRPEFPGLLTGPCDEERARPGVVGTSSSVREMLASKLCGFCPQLADVKIIKEWAGLRTFASDRKFVIGEDPKLKNFYWAAGLGGFGVTCSYSAGELLAKSVLGGKKEVPAEFLPDRFF